MSRSATESALLAKSASAIKSRSAAKKAELAKSASALRNPSLTGSTLALASPLPEPASVEQVSQAVFVPALEQQVETSLHTSRFRWRRAAGVFAIAGISALPIVAMRLRAHGATTRHVQAPMERPATKLLSLRTTPVELIEPPPVKLINGTSWVHPIAGTEEQVPIKGTRLFRAARPGDRPSECGEGHCGVDLDAPRGTPVVSVRPGIIEKVMRDEDASGGRYVWIQHDDLRLRTEYFHLDRVAPDLQVGDTVVAGQWLGTLGRSGIEHSEPHLHFAVRDLDRGERYVDPEPFLEDAVVMGLLEMRLAPQP